MRLSPSYQAVASPNAEPLHLPEELCCTARQARWCVGVRMVCGAALLGASAGAIFPWIAQFGDGVLEKFVGSESDVNQSQFHGAGAVAGVMVAEALLLAKGLHAALCVCAQNRPSIQEQPQVQLEAQIGAPLEPSLEAPIVPSLTSRLRALPSQIPPHLARLLRWGSLAAGSGAALSATTYQSAVWLGHPNHSAQLVRFVEEGATGSAVAAVLLAFVRAGCSCRQFISSPDVNRESESVAQQQV